MPPYSDQDVKRVSRSIIHAESDGLFKCVRACLIGAGCTETHIVHLAVHPGFEEAPRNIDLYVEVYLGCDPYVTRGIRRLEESGGSCIRRYPYDAARAQPFFWTVFSLPKPQQLDPNVPRNRLYDTFKVRDSGEFGVQTLLFGNVLVVKSDRNGTVVDASANTPVLYTWLIHHSFFEDEARRQDYPLVANPLVTPVAGRYRWLDRGKGSGGTLFGEFVLQVLLQAGDFESIYQARRDLEIVVRRDHEEPIIFFFEDLGYESQQVDVPEILQETVGMAHELTKEADDVVFRVKVYSSKSYAIAAVVGNPYTAYWNAITATEIVVFCPRTTFANQSMVCDWYIRGDEEEVPFTLISDNNDWNTECGGECPMKLRKTLEDSDAAIYEWSPHKGDGENDGWGEGGWHGSGWGQENGPEEERRIRNSYFCSSEAIQWRVSRVCRNNHCHDGLMAPARRRVISYCTSALTSLLDNLHTGNPIDALRGAIDSCSNTLIPAGVVSSSELGRDLLSGTQPALFGR
ncbi:hypothetical protein NMY22_g2650 [Coprinellus aureogranulatus]|nr:hypothetical protein NMY22_g2650 [Coprinellus aureogranulatus]